MARRTIITTLTFGHWMVPFNRRYLVGRFQAFDNSMLSNINSLRDEVRRHLV